MAFGFTRIRSAPDFDEKFTSALSQVLIDRAVTWLEQRFAVPHGGPTVVITHFAPARGSIAAKFVGSPLNACFVSDLDLQIRRWQPALWLHGHVHDRGDYRIGNTLIVANPRGHAPQGVVENKAFDASLTIELM